MASVNKVVLVGNLGADPEVKYLPSGDAVANVSLATTDKWKDKASQEWREAVEWHRLVFFGRLAEVVGEYLRKGSQIYVEGSIKTRKWQDSSGADRYSTEIKVSDMQMLGGRQDGGERGGNGGGGGGRDANNTARPQQRPSNGGGQRNAAPAHDDRDIPF